MARIAALVLFTGALLMALAVSGAPAHASSPVVTTLPNGLTVLTMEDTRFPLASIRLYVGTGSSYEDPAQAGISHLLEHMVFKGTHNRAKGQVAADVEKVGGYLNAATSFDYTVYYVDMPKDHWDMGMEIIKDMTFGAVIDPEELEREKPVVLAELKRGEDNPGQTLFKSIHTNVWKESSYGWPIIGFRDTVKGISRQDILDYIAEHYQPQNMTLVVVGDVDGAQALAKAQELFGDLKNDRPMSPPDFVELPAEPQGPVISVRPGEWNKVYLAAALPVPGLHDDASAGLDVLSHMLGGDQSSKLYKRFKYELQLVDSISLNTYSLQRGGLLYLSATLEPDKLEPFWRELTTMLGSLSASDFSDEELANAKLNIEDGLFQAKETLSGLASKLGWFQFFEGSPQAEDNYLYNLRSVDRGQLQALLDTYFDPNRLTATLLTPADGNPDGAPSDEPDGPEALGATLTGILKRQWPAKSTQTAAQAVAGGDMEILRVNNCTVVLTPDNTLPYAAVTVYWPGGDDLLPKGKDGLAALTARTMTRGTASRSALEIQDYLAARASSLGVSARRDSFTASAKFPSRFEEDMLGLLEEILAAPAFEKSEVDRAVAEQRAAIKGKEDQPLGLAFRRAFPFLFTDSGYGRLHLGTAGDLAAYTGDDLAAFWKEQAKRPFVLSVCGVYDRENILELAKTLSTALGSGKTGYDYPAPAFGEDRALPLTLPGRNQTHLVQVFPVVGSSHPDTPGLELLETALAGQSGLLFRDLRDKQSLGYTVTAFMWQSPQAGFLAFYIGTDPERREQALKGFDATVALLKSAPLDAADVNRAKNLLTGDYYREHQSLGSRSSEAAELISKGLDRDYNRDIIDRAQKLTPADLQALAQKYLRPEASYLISVDP